MPNILGLLTQDELAEMLGVKKGTLRDWRRKHIGPDYVRVEKLVMYRKVDVERWLETRVTMTNNAATTEHATA